jgi:hypothetical protein
MSVKLYELDKTLRHFLASFIILLSIAVLVGLVFVYHTTSFKEDGVVERYSGSAVTENFEIPDEYAKSVFEMLLNTHNHLFGFAFIFLALGIIFYFNSIINNNWKYFLLTEPFLSVLLTFGGLWLIRFVDRLFIHIVIISAVLTYAGFFIMSAVLLYELLVKAKTADNE